MNSRYPIPAEQKRATRIARLMLAGEVSLRDGAVEISTPVDPMGGPASLSQEEWDLYMPFYGWLSEWDASESRWGDEDLPSDLVASYEVELRAAAETLVTRTRDR